MAGAPYEYHAREEPGKARPPSVMRRLVGRWRESGVSQLGPRPPCRAGGACCTRRTRARGPLTRGTWRWRLPPAARGRSSCEAGTTAGSCRATWGHRCVTVPSLSTPKASGLFPPDADTRISVTLELLDGVKTIMSSSVQVPPRRDPFTVGREEGTGGVLGTAERGGLQLIEFPDEQPVDARLPRLECERRAVGGQDRGGAGRQGAHRARVTAAAPSPAAADTHGNARRHAGMTTAGAAAAGAGTEPPSRSGADPTSSNSSRASPMELRRRAPSPRRRRFYRSGVRRVSKHCPANSRPFRNTAGSWPIPRRRWYS